MIGRSGKLQLTRGTRGVHTGDRGAAISGGNTIWFTGNFFSAAVSPVPDDDMLPYQEKLQ